jgi:excinuclease ABC subunit C
MKKDDGARYFGPFAHSGALRATISWLNRKFGLRACRPLHPGESDYKHCNADIIRNCAAPCIGRIGREAYLGRIDEACQVLEGKGRREIFSDLEQDMAKAAERLDFEKAALLRDVVGNLRKTLNPTRQFTRGRGVPTTLKPSEDLADLGEALGLPGPPRVMECFDISNVSSNHIVASMVRFTGGAPDNQNYRRYRIRTVEGQDDFASMAEVIRRRYSRILGENFSANPELAESQEDPVEIQRRLAKEGRARIVLPDLVIVDGGKGQLSSALRELRQLGLHDLPVIGLAKQREEVFFPGESDPLLIPHDRGALKLLQRIRDEAHRFAIAGHRRRRARRFSESILETVPGLGPAKRRALLRHFGGLQGVLKAGVPDLERVEGIGATLARSLYDHLHPGE